MSTSRSTRGTTTVTPSGPIKATKALTAAVKAISNTRAAIKALKIDERTAFDTVIEAVADRPASILDSRGNVICEVVEVSTTSVKVDDFVQALVTLYPEIASAVHDTWPEAVEAAKVAATKSSTYRKVLPK